MEKKRDKKILLLLVLKILQNTDVNNPLTQETIANVIINGSNKVFKKELYCDRKTVGRYIKTLKEAGYKIENRKGKGFYMNDNMFSSLEKQTIKELVLNSNIDENKKLSIITKLDSNLRKNKREGGDIK